MSDAVSRLTISDVDGVLMTAGEIDAHSAPELAARIAEFESDGDRVIDLSGVQFMDSSGLRVIIEAHQAAEADDSRLILRSPSRSARRIIEVSGLLDHLHLAE